MCFFAHIAYEFRIKTTMHSHRTAISTVGRVGDVLSPTGFPHLPDLAALLVEVMGQVAVAGDTEDLRMVLELLPQLLVVIASRLLSGRQLRTKRQREMLRMGIWNQKQSLGDKGKKQDKAMSLIKKEK